VLRGAAGEGGDVCRIFEVFAVEPGLDLGECKNEAIGLRIDGHALGFVHLDDGDGVVHLVFFLRAAFGLELAERLEKFGV
jgi:hypothetical protein